MDQKTPIGLTGITLIIPPKDPWEILPAWRATPQDRRFDVLDRADLDDFLRHHKFDHGLMMRLRDLLATTDPVGRFTDDQVIDAIAWKLATRELVIREPRKGATGPAASGGGGGQNQAKADAADQTPAPARAGPQPPAKTPPGRLKVTVIDDKTQKVVANVKVTGPSTKSTNAAGVALWEGLAPATYISAVVTPLPDAIKADLYLPVAESIPKSAVVPSGATGEITFRLEPRPWPTITLADPKIVLVKHDYMGPKRLALGIVKQGIPAHRIPVALSFEETFDGDADFTCDHPERIRVFQNPDDPDDKAVALPLNVKNAELKAAIPLIPFLPKGKIVWIEAIQPSASMSDTVLTLTLKGGTIPPKKNPATEKITCVLLELDIYKWRPEDGSNPVKIADGPKFNPGRAVLVQGPAGHLWAQRAKMVLLKAKPFSFTGKLVLKPITNGVEAFAADREHPATGQTPLSGAGLTFANAAINQANGITFWVEGKTLSGAMGDTGWTVELELLPGVEGDRVTMTVIQAELELHKSRTDTPARIPVPAAFTTADKFDKGRFVHIQDPGSHHGRGMIVVKQVKPAGFVGTLVLNAFDAKQTPSYSATKSAAPKITVFDSEVAPAGTAQALPKEIPHPAGFPAAGQTFWVEGNTVSGALRDSELRLGVKEVDVGCDRVEFTVVRFKNVHADIPSTPANTPRLGNSPVARHDFRLATGALAATDFDDNFTTNAPVVLVEDSIRAADQIVITVQVDPPHVPVQWSAQRDNRTTAPKGDHADIKAMSPNPTPHLTPDAADPLKTKLLAGATGSFHICPYVDCNDTNKMEYDDATGTRIDREPFIMMNLVLVRVQGFTNGSVAPPPPGNGGTAVPVGAPPSPVPTAATGVSVFTGTFASGAAAGVHNIAVVEVIGGGDDGLRGLTSLFAGWVNNELSVPGSPSAPPTEDVLSNYTMPAAPPAPPPAPPPPPPVVHPRFSEWAQPPVHGIFQKFTPANAVPFTVQAGPVLDVSPFGNEGTGGNTCVGTETPAGPGPPIPIAKNARPRPAGGGNLGQRWTVEQWDSPGDLCPAQHEGFAAAVLTNYRFNLNFSTDLLFWTNITNVPGPTPDPACRLYSTVQTNTWNIRFSCNFSGPGGAMVVTNALAVVLAQDANVTRKSIPVQNPGCETRAPFSLKLLIVNATT